MEHLFSIYTHFLLGHMEKQETEMKRKTEMETGNGNWKQKWEQKMHQSLGMANYGFIPRP